MSKIKHYPAVHIVTNVYTTKEDNVKVQVFEFPSFSNVLIAEFWVPVASLKKVGNSKYVPTEIVRARCKHLGFTFGHNSATYK